MAKKHKTVVDDEYNIHSVSLTIEHLTMIQWIHNRSIFNGRTIIIILTCVSFLLIYTISSEYKEKAFRSALEKFRFSGEEEHHVFDPMNMQRGDFDIDYHLQEDDTVADYLRNKIRVLCWVMTGPDNHKTKAIHVKHTWGRRCTILLFMSSEYDETLPTVALNVSEGRNNLWAKTKAAFKHVYDNYRNEAEWFMKADDDTYVIVENMRYMLSSYNYSQPIYFGGRFKPHVKQGYMSGGSGYILSKRALEMFIEEALPNKKICSDLNGGAEDVEVGKCLYNVGVVAADSRDKVGRWRFFPLDIYNNLIPGYTSNDSWYRHYNYYDMREGVDCCSDIAVSFHYISPREMYKLEYYVYHLKPYGINVNMHSPELHSCYDDIGVPRLPSFNTT